MSAQSFSGHVARKVQAAPSDSVRARFTPGSPSPSLQLLEAAQALQAASDALATLGASPALGRTEAELEPAEAPATQRRPQGAHAVLALVIDTAVCVACGHEGPTGSDFGYRWRGDRGGYTRRSRCHKCENAGRRPARG